MRILRAVTDSMTVMLCDGFEASAAAQVMAAPPEERHGVRLRPRLESSTSVDREDEVQSLVLQEGEEAAEEPKRVRKSPRRASPLFSILLKIWNRHVYYLSPA